MTKVEKLEIIYSRQNSDFIKGKIYSNPRFFTTPRSGVTKVYIAGNWPKVEKAYKALGVPIEHLDEGGIAIGEIVPIEVKNEPQDDMPQGPDYSGVVIPEGWRDLPWVGAQGDVTLRSLASQMSEGNVINKPQAVAAITAELARRGVPAVFAIQETLDTATTDQPPPQEHQPNDDV